jgi:Ribbon-helix-helix protein, copG family
MSPKSSFARIAITLPRPVLAAADQAARALDRSRSWVIAEAVRRFISEPPTPASAPRAGIGPSRQAQLEADLRLAPAQRVREAEDTLRTSRIAHGARRDGLVAFDRYEDYLDWKRLQDAGV